MADSIKKIINNSLEPGMRAFVNNWMEKKNKKIF